MAVPWEARSPGLVTQKQGRFWRPLTSVKVRAGLSRSLKSQGSLTLLAAAHFLEVTTVERALLCSRTCSSLNCRETARWGQEEPQNPLWALPPLLWSTVTLQDLGPHRGRGQVLRSPGFRRIHPRDATGHRCLHRGCLTFLNRGNPPKPCI